MDVIAQFDYGHVMVSAAIILGFIGFGALVGTRFHPNIHTGDESRVLNRLYCLSLGVVVTQMSVIILVVTGLYSTTVHAALLCAALALIVWSFILVVRLRRLEGAYRKWGGLGRDGGGEQGGPSRGASDDQPR